MSRVLIDWLRCDRFVSEVGTMNSLRVRNGNRSSELALKTSKSGFLELVEWWSRWISSQFWGKIDELLELAGGVGWLGLVFSELNTQC